MDSAESPLVDGSPTPATPAPDAPAASSDAPAPAASDLVAEAAAATPGSAPGPAAPKASAGPSKPRRAFVRIVGAPPEPDATRPPAEVALRALPVAGVSRRRAAWVLGVVISLWIVAVFARQVGDAAAAAARADQVRADNAALAATVTALQHERDVVQERSFIEFQARAYGLGNASDQRFTLAPNAPPLPSNAPGSASIRLEPAPVHESPLDSWLALLFGPSPQGH